MISPNHLNNILLIIDEVKLIHFHKTSLLHQSLISNTEKNKSYRLITDITKLELLINQLEVVIKSLEKI